MEINKIISIAFTLVLLGILLPIGLNYLLSMPSMQVPNLATADPTDTVAFSTLLDGSLITIITVVIPLMIILGIAIYYIPKMRSD